MPQQDIHLARKLIKQKEYGKARDILLQINDPTANRWLLKLDELDPPSNKQKLKLPSFPMSSLLLMSVSIGINIWMLTNKTRFAENVILVFIFIIFKVKAVVKPIGPAPTMTMSYEVVAAIKNTPSVKFINHNKGLVINKQSYLN